MGRWEPNARGRLEKAAMELYGEHGFHQTTVTEIAERAGLTERTFFRHFADKKEVLFSGAASLQELLVQAVDDAPEPLAAIDAVGVALEAVAEAMQERRDFAKWRQAIIAANPDLQERELIKLASLGSALAAALRERGVGETAASLAAESGIAAFRVGFERWIGEAGETRTYRQIMKESLKELKAVTSGRTPPTRTPPARTPRGRERPHAHR